MRKVRAYLIVLCLAAGLAVAPAHADPRTLAVPGTAGWKHGLTGLVLMPSLAGFTRSAIGDYGQDEYDVFAQYKGEGASDATIYLFHPGIDSVPLWFDRARRVIELRDIFAVAPGTQPTVTAFAPPGSSVASGLRATYALGGKSRYASTGVAVMPVGDWLVVVRVSSAMLNADVLDARIAALAGAIRFPAGLAPGPAAVPVTICDPVKGSAKAHPIAPDMMQALMVTAVAAAARKDHPSAPTYCRAGDSGAKWGQYRVSGEGDGYVLAVADAGRAIGVFPATSLTGGSHGYAVSIMDLARTSFLPSFDRLPSPDLAFEAATRGQPYASVNTIGDSTGLTLDGGLSAKPK